MNNYHQYYYHSYYYKKPRSYYGKTRPGVSLLALVLCLFTFHALDVSLCDAMRDVRFLFFFSNAIVLVIMADYGTFVSSCGVENVEESYGMVAVGGPAPYSVVAEVGSYVEDAEVVKELPEGEDDVLVQERSEEVKLLTYNGSGNVEGDVDGNEEGEGSRAADEEEQVAEEGEENHQLPRVSDETDKDDGDGEGSTAVDEEEKVVVKEEEDDEFSQMSDEELNKRVEEFIWRLKTQIRLQAERDTE